MFPSSSFPPLLITFSPREKELIKLFWSEERQHEHQQQWALPLMSNVFAAQVSARPTNIRTLLEVLQLPAKKKLEE
jgi:hypothetical protein